MSGSLLKCGNDIDRDNVRFKYSRLSPSRAAIGKNYVTYKDRANPYKIIAIFLSMLQTRLTSF
jgi:hypothetical protein